MIYVYCVESFAHNERYSDCSRRGSHLNPLLRCYLVCVAPSLYSVVLCTRVAWVCLVCLLLCKEECSHPVSAITERRDMGMYPSMFCVALSMDLFVLCVASLTVFVNCLLKQFEICLVKQFAICLGVLFCC